MREILSGTRSFTYNEVFRKGEREEIDGQNEYINYIGSNRIYYLRRIHRGWIVDEKAYRLYYLGYKIINEASRSNGRKRRGNGVAEIKLGLLYNESA